MDRAGVNCARVLSADAYPVAAGAGTPVPEQGSCADDGFRRLGPAWADVVLAAHSPALDIITRQQKVKKTRYLVFCLHPVTVVVLGVLAHAIMIDFVTSGDMTSYYTLNSKMMIHISCAMTLLLHVRFPTKAHTCLTDGTLVREFTTVEPFRTWLFF